MEHTRTKQKHGSHGFHLPSQFFLGLIFFLTGGLLLLKKIGLNYLPYIPESVLVYICALGSFLGGMYLVVHKIWRPRIYV